MSQAAKDFLIGRREVASAEMIDRDLTDELSGRAIPRVLTWDTWYGLNLRLPMRAFKLPKSTNLHRAYFINH